MTENYVYKKEVDWSLLREGLGLPVDNQVVFGRIMGRFLKRGEKKQIKIYFNGKSYSATINNLNFDERFNRKKDTYQIRYPRNGELAQALQRCFFSSFRYLKQMRETKESGKRPRIHLPDEDKEYLAIYTTEYDDSYIFEPIVKNDLSVVRNYFIGMNERVFE